MQNKKVTVEVLLSTYKTYKIKIKKIITNVKKKKKNKKKKKKKNK